MNEENERPVKYKVCTACNQRTDEWEIGKYYCQQNEELIIENVDLNSSNYFYMKRHQETLDEMKELKNKLEEVYKNRFDGVVTYQNKIKELEEEIVKLKA